MMRLMFPRNEDQVVALRSISAKTGVRLAAKIVTCSYVSNGVVITSPFMFEQFKAAMSALVHAK